jgi:hypothetical protein
LFSLAELEPDSTKKINILQKAINLLDNELKTIIDNPPLNIEPPKLIFIKSGKSEDVKVEISLDTRAILEPLEQELLDLNEQFKEARASKVH